MFPFKWLVCTVVTLVFVQNVASDFSNGQKELCLKSYHGKNRLCVLFSIVTDATVDGRVGAFDEDIIQASLVVDLSDLTGIRY